MKNKILIGITLFSMFFGAGNLIFPPFLGAEAGTSGWLAFVGLSFCLFSNSWSSCSNS